MLTFFSNALRTSTGATWMASVNASSSVLSNTVTSSFSNSCSAWSTVKALRTSGLETISVICSLLAWAGIVTVHEPSTDCNIVLGTFTCVVGGNRGSVVSTTEEVGAGTVGVGAVVLERGTKGTVIDVGGATVSTGRGTVAIGGGTVSGSRVSVVRGISIFGFSSTVVGGLVVSMGRTSIGCAIVPVGTTTMVVSTGRTRGMVIGAI